ncbi:ESPR domain-containing protein [Burkholderia seminalis]|uniref:ESPR domain-containing protein n=2 Tax=Burkholderia seminalis TaxID=488731 RepID=UPI001906B2CC|nr:ESPR domain-containing protein [Burkholderia seminalis]MBJ9965610.1 ESPR domain-containing protein [Burkholderia seminalis]
MNRIYNLVWNTALHGWVVVPEIAKRSVRTSGKRCLVVGAVAAALGVTSSAFALDLHDEQLSTATDFTPAFSAPLGVSSTLTGVTATTTGYGSEAVLVTGAGGFTDLSINGGAYSTGGVNAGAVVANGVGARIFLDADSRGSTPQSVAIFTQGASSYGLLADNGGGDSGQ